MKSSEQFCVCLFLFFVGFFCQKVWLFIGVKFCFLIYTNGFTRECFFSLLGGEGLVEGFLRSVKSLGSFIVVPIKPLVFKHWTISGTWEKGNKYGESQNSSSDSLEKDSRPQQWEEEIRESNSLAELRRQRTEFREAKKGQICRAERREHRERAWDLQKGFPQLFGWLLIYVCMRGNLTGNQEKHTWKE